MSTNRDPRVDPQPGDVLRRGEKQIMIHAVEHGHVYFGNTEQLVGRWIEIDRFREDAKEAEVREMPEVRR